jgi:hypothetical protein
VARIDAAGAPGIGGNVAGSSGWQDLSPTRQATWERTRSIGFVIRNQGAIIADYPARRPPCRRSRHWRCQNPELLDLAGNGVATDAERLRGLDPPATGVRQRAVDQDPLESLRQLLMHLPGVANQQAVHRLASALSQSSLAAAGDASRSSGGRSATSTSCPGAMTVSQWQRFSSCRTLPEKSSAQRCFRAASEKRLPSTPKFLRAFLQEVASENRNVLTAFAQARQTYPDHVQAMKQVFAKQSLPDPRFEILVRRGNDADLCLEGRMAANAIVMTIGKHAQQPRLQLRRHIADFVEEQRPALGLLETPLPLRRRTGKCAAFMAEELGLEQIAREWRRC